MGEGTGSVSWEEQRRRFESRKRDPLQRWKPSEMELGEHRLYVRHSLAEDTTFQYTAIKQARRSRPSSPCSIEGQRASRMAAG
jgi:hypothetical protein